ncbi:beta transducin [Paraconiothyrium brasiliense]|uniref:Beta transducin n=1 Tax=Paraconiothyrium brasiliense TaxID=300254 RepID=A0ABR3RIM2_9PLEO
MATPDTKADDSGANVGDTECSSSYDSEDYDNDCYDSEDYDTDCEYYRKYDQDCKANPDDCIDPWCTGRAKSLIVVLKVRTVFQDEHGLVDPTPRRSCIPITQRNQEASPFLRLPPEIRNEIYKHVFSGVYIRGRRGFVFYSDPEVPWFLECKTLSLLRVCRSIYAETRLLPFALCCFHFSELYNGPFFRFLQVQFEAITEIQIRHFRSMFSWECIMADTLENIKLLRGLKRVKIHPGTEDDSFAQKKAIEFQAAIGGAVEVEYDDLALEYWEMQGW